MSEMVWMLIENEGAVLLAQRKPRARSSPGAGRCRVRCQPRASPIPRSWRA